MPSWCSNYGISLLWDWDIVWNHIQVLCIFPVRSRWWTLWKFSICCLQIHTPTPHTNVPHANAHTILFLHSCWVFFSQALIEFSLMPSHQRKCFVSFVREAIAATQTYAPSTTQTHTQCEIWMNMWPIFSALLCHAQKFQSYREEKVLPHHCWCHNIQQHRHQLMHQTTKDLKKIKSVLSHPLFSTCLSH